MPLYRSQFGSGLLSRYQSSFGGSAATPAPPSSGQKLWLRADSVVSSGGLVSQATDLSPSANNLTAAGSARPTLLAGALNGNPAFTMNGSTTALASGSSPVAPGSDRTVFLVCKSTAGSNLGGIPFSFRKSATDMYIAMGIVSTSYAVGGGAVNGTLHAANWMSNTWQLLQINLASGTATLWINGTSTALDAATGFAADSGTNGCTLGSRGDGTFPFTGPVCEAIVYDHALSSPDVATAKAYFKSRYPSLTIA